MTQIVSDLSSRDRMIWNKMYNSAKQKFPSKTRNALAVDLQEHVRLAEAVNNQGRCQCICCGQWRPWNRGMQGGHYIAKSVSGFLAVEPLNIWPECEVCNSNKHASGPTNAEFHAALVKRIGQEQVDWLNANKGRPAENDIEVLVWQRFHVRKKNAAIKKEMAQWG